MLISSNTPFYFNAVASGVVMVSSDYAVVSSGYHCGIFWLVLLYLLVTPVVSSGYPCGIF